MYAMGYSTGFWMSGSGLHMMHDHLTRRRSVVPFWHDRTSFTVAQRSELLADQRVLEGQVAGRGDFASLLPGP